MTRPLFVTALDGAREGLARLAAAAGTEADVVDDVASARRLWLGASVVVVGADLVDRLVVAAMPRRTGVVLLGADLDDAGVWQRAVEVGAERVVFLPDAADWLVDLIGRAGATGRVGLTLGVMGGRGGCGASTLAAALALTATRLGRSAVLVDADPLGGGIDLLLGAEDVAGPRWPDLAGAPRHAIGLLSLLPTVQRTAVLSWDRDGQTALRPGVVASVLADTRREMDLVVLDLPRQVDDGAAGVLTSLQTLLLVVPADVRGVAASSRVAAVVAPYVDDVQVVVRRPSGGIDAGFVAETLGLPLAGRFKPDRSLSADGDRGVPPAGTGRGHLARLCVALVRELVPARDHPRSDAA